MPTVTLPRASDAPSILTRTPLTSTTEIRLLGPTIAPSSRLIWPMKSATNRVRGRL
jgi:hypothetical protein